LFLFAADDSALIHGSGEVLDKDASSFIYPTVTRSRQLVAGSTWVFALPQAGLKSGHSSQINASLQLIRESPYFSYEFS
jgi:hypothetical protein